MNRFFIFLLGLLIVSCSGDDTPRDTGFDRLLVGNWALLRYANAAGESILESPEDEILTEFRFQDNRTLNIQSTCNLISGDYSTTEDLIRIENSYTTLVFCFSDWEAKLYDALRLSRNELGLYEFGFLVDVDNLILQLSEEEFMHLEKIIE